MSSGGIRLESVMEIAGRRIEHEILRRGLRQGVQVRIQQEAGRVGQGAGGGQFHHKVERDVGDGGLEGDFNRAAGSKQALYSLTNQLLLPAAALDLHQREKSVDGLDSLGRVQVEAGCIGGGAVDQARVQFRGRGRAEHTADKKQKAKAMENLHKSCPDNAGIRTTSIA